ncbi:MAG: hypothetical protein GXO19_02130 [Epsilonproteobacteria bacterium]|nr:hypothetical protein [Campylobacterota bacterium]NPA56515.1 hypothetical protein [Campylobacterota bacterium]
MKKIALCLLIGSILFGSSVERLKAQLIEYIATKLNAHSPVTRIYVANGLGEEVESYFRDVEVVDRCEEADIIFTKKISALPESCLNKLIFVTSYGSYKRHKDRTIGAFFWQKGRPNIIFNTKKISQLHIELPKEFEKYME